MTALEQLKVYLSLTAPFWVERPKAIAAVLSHHGMTLDAVNAAAATLLERGEMEARESVVKDEDGKPMVFWRERSPL